MNYKVFTIGFAIFTMFFGAGNITLPLILAQKWPVGWISSYIGFCLTGVIITFLGLISAVYSQSTQKFFKPLGVKFGFIMQFILILIEGPFGVVPRCLIVAFGGVKTIFPDVINWIFYLFCSVMIYSYAINKSRLVTGVGNYITPVLLTILVLLISSVIITNQEAISWDISFNKDTFFDGIVHGYLTYDLPGAIYFTGIALTYLNSVQTEKSKVFKLGIAASFISAVLLIAVYAAFFYLGVKNIDIIYGVPPEQILPTIILKSFGKIFAVIFSGFVFLACITTAIAAITIWTDFVFKHITHNKKWYRVILVVSLLIANIVAMFHFSGLIKMLTPILSLVYPILILLSIYNIFANKKKMHA